MVIVERFGDAPAIAHTFLSFGFGGEYLAISVEQYELMYVIADERDVIGLRTHYRRDPVYMYPVTTTPDKIRRVFVEMLERSNKLATEPEFYSVRTRSHPDRPAVRSRAGRAPHRRPCAAATGGSELFAAHPDKESAMNHAHAAPGADTAALRSRSSPRPSPIIRAYAISRSRPTLAFLSEGQETARLVRPADANAIRQALAQIDPAVQANSAARR